MGLLRQGFAAEGVTQMARQERGSGTSPEGRREEKLERFCHILFWRSSEHAFLQQFFVNCKDPFLCQNDYLVFYQVCLFGHVVLAFISHISSDTFSSELLRQDFQKYEISGCQDNRFVLRRV